METLEYGFLPVVKKEFYFEVVQNTELLENCGGTFYQLVKSNNINGNFGQLALLEV